MDLSVIIVNYNTYDYTKGCIESVLSAEDYLRDERLEYEIILVDNASADGSIEWLEQEYADESRIKIIRNSDNFGFSVANNIGIKEAVGAYLLLLNSDTVIAPDALVKTIAFMDNHPECGVLGAKVSLADGSLDHACKRSFPTPSSGFYHSMKLDKAFPGNKTFGAYDMTWIDPDTTAEIDCTTGAYMCVSRAAYEKTGGLDEDYFMYGEDIDWCYRIKQNGFKIIYYPDVKVTHYKKASWNAKKDKKVLDAFYDSMLIFYDKHYQGKYNFVTNTIVRSGTGILKSFASFRNSFK
ncbi:MAG: glycosyltransferase family 2 protein [Eubacteriaceae bacterium]|jgi:GT2 family glycosyltransferase